jgi:long-chain acyl-CoA synthetase
MTTTAFGWVGPPGPGIEQKIAEDGEVMYRGRNVMKEYYKMPEETAATITATAGSNRGSGQHRRKQFLRITGRKKRPDHHRRGQEHRPGPIEGVIATSKYINQVCVIGDSASSSAPW